MSPDEGDRVLLDSNILFSASYRSDSPLRRFWSLPRVQLLASPYIIDEASRNVGSNAQQYELEALLAVMEIVQHQISLTDPRIEPLGLPIKDQPVMLAAIDGDATHLVTGDWNHFGHLFWHRVHGVLVLPTNDYP